MPNYADAAILRDMKIGGYRIDWCDYKDDELEAKIDLAESLIENITGDIFYELSETTYKFDGSGHSVLHFKPRVVYRLVSADSVTIVDNDDTLLYTCVENTDFVTHAYYLETIRSLPMTSTRNLGSFGNNWPLGLKNIKITGTWGRATVPLEIVEATKLLAAEFLLPGSTQSTSTFAGEAEWDDFRIKRDAIPHAQVGQSTGFVEIDRLLYPHINYVNMFNVVPDKRHPFDSGVIRAI